MLKHEVSSKDIEIKKQWKRNKEALWGRQLCRLKKSGHEVALGLGKETSETNEVGKLVSEWMLVLQHPGPP